MQAGNLDSKITIKRLSKTSDQFGGFTSTLLKTASSTKSIITLFC